ncbi:hypothetical protein UFOVP820_23 [uncultured Caudovirales phage]|uniref:Uncharacterized protein n=1 Tax=uncultured Caudovirales phage TaxID=2100421 RepID=A0A6J5P5J6_9CAUD|nr:hypothetical protein UFOVP820_23 [uncultured Caudovirales phage]
MAYVTFVDSKIAISGDQIVLWQKNHYEYELENRSRCVTWTFHGAYEGAVAKFEDVIRGEDTIERLSVPAQTRVEAYQNRFIEDLLKPYL